MCALGLQPLDHFEQVADRTGEAIETNHDEHVSGADFHEKPGQLRPGARSPGTMFLDNRQATGGP